MHARTKSGSVFIALCIAMLAPWIASGQDGQLISPDYIYFLAVRVTGSTAGSIANRQSYIATSIKKNNKKILPHLHPHPQNQLHITLQQIGRLPNDNDVTLSKIIDAMWDVAENEKVTPFNIHESMAKSKFEVWKSGYLVFKLDKDPGGSDRLSDLVDFIRSKLIKAYPEYDAERWDYNPKNWIAHTSIGTFSGVDYKTVKEAITKKVWPPACSAFRVNQFVLFRSDQNLDPREYEEVETFTFGVKADLSDRDAPGESDPDEGGTDSGVSAP